MRSLLFVLRVRGGGRRESSRAEWEPGVFKFVKPAKCTTEGRGFKWWHSESKGGLQKVGEGRGGYTAHEGQRAIERGVWQGIKQKQGLRRPKLGQTRPPSAKERRNQ